MRSSRTQRVTKSEKRKPKKRSDLRDRLHLTPVRSLRLVKDTGVTELAAEEISAANVGVKACGLAAMPIEWVPRFFVVDPLCLQNRTSDAEVQKRLSDEISRCGLSETDKVIVRSSGGAETMGKRGQLVSQQCFPSEVATVIRQLNNNLPSEIQASVHWIVQEVIPTQKLGHLSNERHLRKESRDWIVEVEAYQGRPGYTVPFAIRSWRDGIAGAEVDLSCTSELEISRKLRRVAMWAMRFSTRIHFEWVWDGRNIWVVQAQTADEDLGTDPSTVIPAHLPTVNVATLKSFRLASERDYQIYRKLRNAQIYSALGYDMPTFYVLDDPAEIKSILSGKLSKNVAADIAELTKRALMLRTDGESIPEHKREMLPRSEELRSSEAAALWLVNEFKSAIENSDLNDAQICLIAHHFIPSVASAWAGAEPGNRIVRIESLWGIPEGLYWYSHDTFEVDTLSVKMSSHEEGQQNYKTQKRLRYKGTFIAPDENGNWVRYQTAEPFDWSPSARKKWLMEIARTTRLVAEREQHAISLMWFLDNHPEATKDKVLPWFHSKIQPSGPIKAAPRRKFTSTTDSVVRTTADWIKLKDELISGKRIERVVVEPGDAELIRNRQFAEHLGKLAAANKFVVELSGGILSHVFYILRSQGARVECKDLYGDEEDIVEYDKLVRDKIPQIIEARGEHVQTVRLKGNALVTALRQKLVEEAFEAKDARSIDDLAGEIADVAEVIEALSKAVELSPQEIASTKEQKRKNRGGFNAGLMLIKTATPHSIHRTSRSTPPELTLNPEDSDEVVISDPNDIPSKRTYRRPDLRQVAQQLEKMFTFETELNTIGNKRFDFPLRQTLDFSLPVGNQKLNMTLTIELVRSGSSLRGVVRLRSGAIQLPIEFPPSEKQLKIPFSEE